MNGEDTPTTGDQETSTRDLIKLEYRAKAHAAVMEALKGLDEKEATMVINSAQVLISGRVALPQKTQG